jgi:hypothetical protein
MENAPITFTLAQAWAWLLALAGAVVALAAAGGQLVKLFDRIRKPNTEQNKRLDAHDKKLKEHDEKFERYDQFFANDNARLDAMDASARVTQKALLALLSHAIDGNNTKQLEDAKASLQEFLINR